MTKKRVTVYMTNEDIDWLKDNPITGTYNGSAVLLIEWAVRQIQRGRVTALEKLNDDERSVIIAYANSLLISADFTPTLLVMGLTDWFRFDEGSGWDWSAEKKQSLLETCKSLSPAEVIGLLGWAKNNVGETTAS